MEDQQHKDALRLLFRYYVTENFLERDYYETADELADDLERFADLGWAAVIDDVNAELEYLVLVSNPIDPTDDEALHLAFNQKFLEEENGQQLVDAAMLIWKRKEGT